MATAAIAPSDAAQMANYFTLGVAGKKKPWHGGALAFVRLDPALLSEFASEHRRHLLSELADDAVAAFAEALLHQAHTLAMRTFQ